ncbi:Unknown protein sequence [Pseudomonas syringae pv. cilantro]|uniref:Uncharacterized protein n=1 Tax=Pseudomonas syringae pv. cilantro TaxID=81035 RepID=A0A0N0X8L9_PSESX|nr:Unknown protein sequence [Pseudomonas syringae pv. cilantro]
MNVLPMGMSALDQKRCISVESQRDQWREASMPDGFFSA